MDCLDFGPWTIFGLHKSDVGFLYPINIDLFENCSAQYVKILSNHPVTKMAKWSTEYPGGFFTIQNLFYYIVQIFCMWFCKADFIYVYYCLGEWCDPWAIWYMYKNSLYLMSCLLIHETLPVNRRFNLVYVMSGYRLLRTIFLNNLLYILNERKRKQTKNLKFDNLKITIIVFLFKLFWASSLLY